MIDMTEFEDNALPNRLFPIIRDLAAISNATETALESELLAISSLADTVDGKQATLVSGTNIKTVGGASILGAGDLPISTEAGKYGCSVWKEGDAVNPVTGTVAGYNVTWHNDGQLNTTTGEYTVPVTGLYAIDFDALKHNDNAASEARLYKNGSPTGVRGYAAAAQGNTGNASAGTAHTHFFDGSTQYASLHLKIAGNFNAGDVLKIVVTTGALHGNESCYLNIHKVR
jgi:hypothetical protein